MEDEPRRNYRLEDFLWTGSGDGGEDESLDVSSTWKTTTVFRTTTILTTVFPTPIYTGQIPDTPECQGGECYISATPTYVIPSATAMPPWPPPPSSSAPPWPPSFLDNTPDERYWLITILQTNTSNWDMSTEIFEPRLAKLYEMAFQR